MSYTDEELRLLRVNMCKFSDITPPQNNIPPTLRKQSNGDIICIWGSKVSRICHGDFELEESLIDESIRDIHFPIGFDAPFITSNQLSIAPIYIRGRSFCKIEKESTARAKIQRTTSRKLWPSASTWTHADCLQRKESVFIPQH